MKTAGGNVEKDLWEHKNTWKGNRHFIFLFSLKIRGEKWVSDLHRRSFFYSSHCQLALCIWSQMTQTRLGANELSVPAWLHRHTKGKTLRVLWAQSPGITATKLLGNVSMCGWGHCSHKTSMYFSTELNQFLRFTDYNNSLQGRVPPSYQGLLLSRNWAFSAETHLDAVLLYHFTQLLHMCLTLKIW